MYPSCIQKLVESLMELPGIGEKTAGRLAYSFINFDEDALTDFSNAIIDIRDNIKKCEVCGNWTDKNKCSICSDDARSTKSIFVVENSKDIVLFEKIGVYKGVYHVLDGLISPLDGVNPDDLNISSLMNRIRNGNYEEIILALKPSIEGETTMQYIKKLLENTNIKVSRIASGIPMGADMEYVDSMTLEMALEQRKDMA